MTKLLNHTGLFAGLWLAIAQTALAQNAATLEYSDASADRTGPRVLHYSVEPTKPESEDAAKRPA